MDSAKECYCLREISQVEAVTTEGRQAIGTDLKCITDHPGIYAVCFDPWSLQVAWLAYRQQYGGNAFHGPQDAKFRHVAYRQL